MNFAKPTDGLLTASSTLKLVELVERRPDGVSLDRLIRDLSAIVHVSRSRTLNTIIKLNSYGVFQGSPQASIVSMMSKKEDWNQQISILAAKDFASRLSKTGTWRCISRDSASKQLAIDSRLLPPMHDGLGVWLIDFGVAQRSKVEERYWTINDPMTDLFMDEAKTANRKSPRRAKSAERLAEELAQQIKFGEEAELWVLDYEHNRLKSHPLSSQIRKVSSDDVSAGYDIMSFKNDHSINLDLFIEVKSHGERKVFHWSRNEIATALEFGNDYVLYLVDRKRMSCPNYHPHIINGPTPEMFSLVGSGWRVEATSFEHVAISN